MLTYFPGIKRKKDLNNFYQEICEQPFRAEHPDAPGILQTLLKQGEFGALGKVPIFESTFLQVTKRGEFINIHNHANVIIMGILASSPRMLLPNLLIIAQEKKDQTTKELEIKRMIPLEMVDIFVHDLSKRRLKVQMITGRKYYLQLCAPEGEQGFLFERWIRLIYLLRSIRGNVATPVTSTDPTLHTIWKSANIPRRSSSASRKAGRLVHTMVKDSTELLREQQKKNKLSKKTKKATSKDSASQQKIQKSGFAEKSSHGTLQVSDSGEDFREKSEASFARSPPQALSRNATQPSIHELGSQTGCSSPQKSSSSQKSSKSKQASAQSFVRFHPSTDTIPEYNTLLVGAEPSLPIVFLETTDNLKSARRKSYGESTQKSVGWLPSGVERDARASVVSEVIKLQRSQKSRSLVQTPTVPSPGVDLSHSEKKDAIESQVKRPSSRGEREASASQNVSRKHSRSGSKAASTRASAASTAPRDHTSEDVGVVEQSEASRATSAKSRASERSALTPPGSQPDNKASSSGKKRTSDTSAKPLKAVNKEEAAGIGDRPPSREVAQRSKPSKEYKTSAKSPKPSKTTRHRSQASSSPSPEQGHSTSPSPDRKKDAEVQVHRTIESSTLTAWKTKGLEPSEVVRSDQSRPQSQEKGKQKELKTGSSRDKSGKQSQPSSSKGQHESSRILGNEPKKKLKSALSSAKQRSSLTFVTIYSVLSSSLERIKRSKSKEESKPSPPEKTLQVTSKPSKRVTISGVTGPSGKDFLQEETGNLSPEGTPRMKEDSSVAAPLGTEASAAPSASVKAAEPSEANTAAVNAEASTGGHISRAAERTRPGSRGSSRKSSVARTLQKPSRKRAGQSSTRDRERRPKAKKDLVTPREISPNSKPSEKFSSTRDAPKKGKVSSDPARSKKFISAGPSVDIVAVLTGHSSIGDGGRAWEQEEPRVKSQKKSRRDENWRPNSQPSAEPSKPASSVSRKANERSKDTGLKTAGATKPQQQSQTGPRERTSSGPAGHVPEESASKPKSSKKSFLKFAVGRLPLDMGHRKRKTESVVMESSQMDKDTPAADQSKLSSKTEPRLQDSRLFRPGGWIEYVEMGERKSKDKEPLRPKKADSSRSRSRAARRVTRPSNEPAIHSGGDTTARSGL